MPKKIFADAPEGSVERAEPVKTHRVLYFKADRSAPWHPLKSVEQGDPDEDFVFAAERVEKVREAKSRGAVAPLFRVATERAGEPV